MVGPNMSPFFKKTYIRLKPEITSGVCPHCDDMSSFVSIVNDTYRCMNCGFDVEQKINGVIKYLPIGQDKVIEDGPKKA
jgi:Zn ribbon nucleic-acid-binding protein